MAKKAIKIKAKAKGGVITVKSLMNHVMESGMRKDKKTGEKIPAHFINEVVGEHNGKVVITASWGGGISKNPYLSFKVPGAKGDEIKISWTDSEGATAEETDKAR